MILPSTADRPIVIFKVWSSLEYHKRLLASFALIAAGLILQLVTGQFVWGAIPIVLGNLLMLVSGYDNRVDFGKYDPAGEWVRVERSRLDELKKMDREIRRWDLSVLDVTNGLGGAFFIIGTASLVIVAIVFPGPLRILALDACLLLLPHWLTGVRSVLRAPKLLVKVDVLQRLFATAHDDLERYKVTLLMLLHGEKAQVPKNVKFRVEPAGGLEDFLGLYGQVVLNEVQGRSYPYFYVVLVARRGFGLDAVYRDYSPPGGLTKEFKEQDKVEVLVIRQTTTKKSGYHTEPWVTEGILHEGLRLLRKIQ